jgi:hypothetical protein
MVSIGDELQRAAYTLKNIAIKYYLKISVSKKKAKALKGKINATIKTAINIHIIKKANSFRYLRYTTTVKKQR